MADAVLRVPDMQALGKLQVLHPPAGAQTPITGALLALSNVATTGFAQAIDILNVASLGAIRVELFGAASDGNGITVDLYGWPEAGGGHHLGQVTAVSCTVSQVFSAATPTINHQSVRDAFPVGTDWRACDTYAVPADLGVGTMIAVPTSETNFPGYFNVDFTNTQYSWFAAVPTTVVGTTAGATFAALSLKHGYNNPQFTG